MASWVDEFRDAPRRSWVDEFRTPAPENQNNDPGFLSSARGAIGQMVQGTGQALEDLGWEDNAIKSYGKGVVERNQGAIHSLGDIADRPVQAVREATGNAAGSVGTMLGARVLGTGVTALAPFTGPFAPATAAVGQAISWGGPALAAALPSYGGIRERQITKDPESSGSAQDKLLAALGAGAVGAIESKFGPESWALSALSKEGREALAKKFGEGTILNRMGKGAVRGALVEGAEELAQNPIEQLAAYDNPTTPANIEDSLFSGAMGALGGGPAGATFGAMTRNRTVPPELQPKDLVNPEPEPTEGAAPVDPELDAFEADQAAKAERGAAVTAEVNAATKLREALRPNQDEINHIMRYDPATLSALEPEQLQAEWAATKENKNGRTTPEEYELVRRLVYPEPVPLEIKGVQASNREAAIAAMADIATQEDARAKLDEITVRTASKRGEGQITPATRKRVEASTWFDSLPRAAVAQTETTTAQPTAEPAAAATPAKPRKPVAARLKPAVTPTGDIAADVKAADAAAIADTAKDDWDAAEVAKLYDDAAADQEAAAKAAAVDDTPTSDIELRSDIPPVEPMAVARERVKSPLPGNVLKTLRLIMSGYNREAKSDTEGDHILTAYTRRAVKRLGLEDVAQAFANIQHITGRIEDMVGGSASASQNYGVNEGAYPMTGGRPGELDIAQRKPIDAKQTADVEAVSAELKHKYAELDQAFRALEEALGKRTQGDQIEGRKHLRTVQYLAKLANVGEGKQQIGRRDVNQANTLRESERPEAVRFHTAYKEFNTRRMSESNDPGARINSDINRNDNRITAINKAAGLDNLKNSKLMKDATTVTFAKAKADAEILPNYPTTSKDQQNAGDLGQRGAYLLLRKLRHTPYSWMARQLASRVMYVLKDNMPKLVIEAKHDGAAGGRYSPRTHTITLYADHYNDVTTLHEFLHAASAMYINNHYNSAEVKRLRSLLAAVQSLGPSAQGREAWLRDVEAQHGARVRQILELTHTADKRTETGLYEFVSYAFTEYGFQQYLKTITEQDLETSGYKLSAKERADLVANRGSLWSRFVLFIKNMLGIQGSNNALSEFIEAGSAVLAQQETTKETKLKGRKPGDMQQMATPEAAIQAEPEVVDQAEEKGRANTMDASGGIAAINKQQAEKNAKAAKEATKQANAATMNELERTAKSPVLPKANKRDVGFLDPVQRGIMDGVASMLSGGKRTDWEGGVLEWLAKKELAIRNYASGEGWLNQKVNYALSMTVDQFGTTDAYRDILLALQGGMHAVTARNVDFAVALQSLKPGEQHQALLDYVDDRDGKRLREAVKDEAAASVIENMVGAADKLIADAKLYHTIDPKYADYTLRDFVDLSAKRWYSNYRDLSMGSVQPIGVKSGSHEGTTVNISDVFDKDGNAIADTAKGQFYQLQRKTSGSVVYIEVGADQSVWDAHNVTAIRGETKPYTLRAVKDGGNGDVRVTFDRRKTLAEINEGKADSHRADVVSSILFTMQDMARKVEGARFMSEMLRTNESMPEADRWITDKKPENVPDSRIIDLTDPNVNRKQAHKQAHVAGTWVLIPAKDTQEWGDLAGKYVAGPVYASIKDFTNTEPVINSVAFRESLALWKKFKTVYSLTTHVNNIAGNVILAYMHDIPFSNVRASARVTIAAAYPKLWKKLGQKELTPAERDLVDEVRFSGAMLGQYQTAEFDNDTVGVLRRFFNDNQEQGAGIRDSVSGMMKLQGVLAAIDNTAMGVYSNQDNIFRMAAYVTHLQNAQALPGQTKSLRVMKEEAALYAKKAFVDYNISAPWVQAARQSVLPFIAWPYRMVPLFAKLAVTRPWKAANIAMVVYALNAVAYSMLGGDGDDEDKEKSERVNLDKYMQGKNALYLNTPSYIRLPFGADGKGIFFGIGRWLPLGDIAQISDSGIPGVLSFSGPAISVLEAAFNFNVFEQKKISSETDTDAEALYKRMAFLGKELGPATAYSATVWAQKMGGAKGPLGSEANMWIETAKLLGVNIRQVDLAEQQFKNMQESKHIMNAYKQAQSSALRQYLREGDPDTDALYDKLRSLNERRQEKLMENMGLEDD